MYRFLRRSVMIFALAALASFSVLAQQKGGTLTCRDNGWYNDRLEGNCEIREQTLAMSGAPIAIDGRQNGGIAVKGWDQNQVLVRARVQTGAPTAAEAADLEADCIRYRWTCDLCGHGFTTEAELIRNEAA